MARSARRASRGLSAAALLLALALAACGGGKQQGRGDEPGRADREAGAPAPGPAALAERPAVGDPAITRASCPEGVPDCRVATGKIVYVERVDPDGDGDAHFVIADPQGITVSGFTAIDVRHGLRPRPLPGLGDVISAAGPVQTGSYGQSQIHALELHAARRPGK